MANLTGEKKGKEKKVFVLDTNVILHEHSAIHKFQEHDIIIPTCVLEELDTFKKGNEEKNHNARIFIRELDVLRSSRIIKKEKSVSALCNGGVSLGEGKGKIEIVMVRKVHSKVREVFSDDIVDHKLLSLVLDLEADLKEKRRIILVTKDINLRLKADALGIDAEDYQNDKIDNLDALYTGKSIVPDVEHHLINDLYESKKILINDISRFPSYHPNQFFIVKNEKKSALAKVSADKQELCLVDRKQPIMGITPKNAEQCFVIEALMDDNIPLVSLMGIAGTGKTLLAMVAGLQKLKDNKYSQIILSSATVPLSNKDIGALPGDITEKVSPYMQGMFDNLSLIKTRIVNKDSDWIDEIQGPKIHPSQLSKKDRLAIKQQQLFIQALASIRGRSLNNTFFVIDEAQNLTPHEVKTIVTRAGEGTKIVFCGDPFQIDVPYLDAYSNGLSYLISKMTGQSEYAHVLLEKGERSKLADLGAKLL